MEERTVTKKDILKHYFSSILIYGVILLFITFCPLYYETIEYPVCNYITVFSVYYLLYVIFALPIFFKFKPKSLLKSRNVTILKYIKRQFTKMPSAEWIKSFSMNEEEKQAFVILFIKVFFGVYCVNMLCNKYLSSLDYNLGFLKEMFTQAVNYAKAEGPILGLIQYIDDTSDMFITLIMTITTTVFAISYITEAEFLKNKIKYADTTPLGVLSCVMCFYPFATITTKLFPVFSEDFIPVGNNILRIILSLTLIITSIISMIAILRLGTKSGNLTNRGIVTGFPYNIVRHPDYSMQILFAITLTIPMFFIDGTGFAEKIFYPLSTCVWIFLFYLRAVTEERNLIKDEKYQQYVEKVKYRFIPYLF